MTNVLFIQGAGSVGAHEEDRALVQSLRNTLGSGFAVHYPPMPDEAEPKFDVWKTTILEHSTRLEPDLVLAGHSIGASVLAKVMTTPGNKPACRGLFLVAAPFWHDDAFWNWPDCTLARDAADRLPASLPVYFYHGTADPFVPVSHLDMYGAALPKAVLRRLPARDHQMNEDLSEVASDIASLI